MRRGAPPSHFCRWPTTAPGITSMRSDAMRVRLTLAALCAVWLGSGAWAETPANAAHAPVFKGDWHMLQTYCVKCHNSEDWAGGVAFDTMNAGSAGDDAKIWEEAIVKLRGGLMPPPGKPQPAPAACQEFAQAA